MTGQKRHGDNVTLTVDSSLCTAILQSFQRRAPGKAGAAVVMNYKTGEVLGMVSLPTFDPMSSSAVSASSNAYWNRVTQNPYTPGSTFTSKHCTPRSVPLNCASEVSCSPS